MLIYKCIWCLSGGRFILKRSMSYTLEQLITHVTGKVVSFFFLCLWERSPHSLWQPQYIVKCTITVLDWRSCDCSKQQSHVGCVSFTQSGSKPKNVTWKNLWLNVFFNLTRCFFFFFFYTDPNRSTVFSHKRAPWIRKGALSLAGLFSSF